MVGPDLYVAAITQADLYLEKISIAHYIGESAPGTWYAYYSGVSTFSSTVPTKLYQLPVFMRGGSVILMYQGLSGTEQ